MAGPSPPYYRPLSKPPSAAAATSYWKKPRVYSLVVVTILCSLSYLFGAWQHSGSTTSIVSATIPCFPSTNITIGAHPSPSTSSPTSTISKELDFATHHSADESAAAATVPEETIKKYPPCDIKYSEYTPCEDSNRSLKFGRNRLIYRERHCPEKDELLKCRVPAPHGYRNPFKWPLSRDLVWYANVPHKELTVEKAVQNWIRYDGDRFRFPGGGTMFPNGAGAYIDDIGKLINLKDGSIRTAIDTGCGVSLIFLICCVCSIFPILVAGFSFSSILKSLGHFWTWSSPV